MPFKAMVNYPLSRFHERMPEMRELDREANAQFPQAFKGTADHGEAIRNLTVLIKAFPDNQEDFVVREYWPIANPF